MKYKDFKYNFLGKKIRISPKYTWKSIQYLFFSSFSLLIGTKYAQPAMNNSQLWHVLAILPSLYVFNFVYSEVCEWVFKHIFCKFTWIKEENHNNIFHCHCLMLNLLAVYYFSSKYLNLLSINNSTSIPIIMFLIYTIFFALHRYLDVLELCEDLAKPKQLDIRLHSFLRKHSYSYTHVFAVTTVGLPFLIGISFGIEDNNFNSLFISSFLSYTFFLFAWIILFQKKYSEEYFLSSYKLILPSSIFPIFLIIFYLIFDNSLEFYILFFLLSFSYITPFILHYSKDNNIVRILTNEKFLLLSILATMAFFLFFEYDLYIVAENDITASSISTAVFSVLAAVLLTKRDQVSSYLYFYPLIPYFIIWLIVGSAWMVNDFFKLLDADSSSSICALIMHTVNAQNFYGIIYIGVILVSLTPKFMERLKNT